MPLLPRQAGVEVRSLYKPLPAGLLFDYEVVKVQGLAVAQAGFEPAIGSLWDSRLRPLGDRAM